MKRQSLERVLKQLNGEQEVVQEVPSAPPTPCATVSSPSCALLQEIDDTDHRPDLPPDVPGDFGFDIDLLEARRDLQDSEQVPWDAVRLRLEELEWNLPLMLGPGSGDAAVQRYLLRQRAEKLLRGMYLAGVLSTQLLPVRESAPVTAGLRACVQRAA